MHDPGEGYCFLCITEQLDRNYTLSTHGEKARKASLVKARQAARVPKKKVRNFKVQVKAPRKRVSILEFTPSPEGPTKPVKKKKPVVEMEAKDLATVIAGNKAVLLSLHKGGTTRMIRTSQKPLEGVGECAVDDALLVAHLDASKDKAVMDILNNAVSSSAAAEKEEEDTPEDGKEGETKEDKKKKKEAKKEKQMKEDSDDEAPVILFIPGNNQAMVRYEGETNADAMLAFLETQEAELNKVLLVPELVDERLDPEREKPVYVPPEPEKPEPVVQIVKPAFTPAQIRMQAYEAKLKADRKALEDKRMEEEAKRMKVKRAAELKLAAELAEEEARKVEERKAMMVALMELEEGDEEEWGSGDERGEGEDEGHTTATANVSKVSVLSQVAIVFPNVEMPVLMGIARLLALFLDTDGDGSGDIGGDELAKVMHRIDVEKWNQVRKMRHELINTGTLEILEEPKSDDDDDSDEEETKTKIDVHLTPDFNNGARIRTKYDEDEEEEVMETEFLSMRLAGKIATLERVIEMKNNQEAKTLAQTAMANPETFFSSVKKPESLEHYEAKMVSNMKQWDLDGDGELDFMEFSMMVCASGFNLDSQIAALGEDVKNAIMSNVGDADIVNGQMRKKPRNQGNSGGSKSAAAALKRKSLKVT